MAVLLVEDEKKLVNILKKSFKNRAYALNIANNGIDAFDMAKNNDYEAIVLDVMLPGMSGFEVCRKLREANIHTPILILSAKDRVEDRINGLDSGADDYLVKPFSTDELFARIRCLSRRRKQAKSPQLKVDNIVLDPCRHEVTRDGKLIELTAKEFSLLKLMMLREGQMIPRREMIDHVWGPDHQENSNQLDVYIRYLRQKVDIPFSKKNIKTVRGFGYKIEG